MIPDKPQMVVVVHDINQLSPINSVAATEAVGLSRLPLWSPQRELTYSPLRCGHHRSSWLIPINVVAATEGVAVFKKLLWPPQRGLDYGDYEVAIKRDS